MKMIRTTNDRCVALIIEAIYKYESIRYGNDQGLGFDAAIDEVLKQMGLEK